MKKWNRKLFCAGAGMLAAFALWTMLICAVDVQAIGPEGTAVGFAAVNGYVHRLTGVHMTLYTITDWLGLVPIGTAMGFALLGLCQWIRRRSLLKVDRSILVLGGFYIAVMAAFLIFEQFIVNYRPVLIEGRLEASYPSSTTLLVLCVMPTALMQFNARIRNAVSRRCIAAAIAVFSAFMVIGRLISGVHWLTDIVGGALLSAGLVMIYRAVCAEEMNKPSALQ
ncbi:MAG: phosphatase PAP2 family protein [Clostridia bacterium]|nr:phosphatase PAP2 family protein [Clostridia bacterium]